MIRADQTGERALALAREAGEAMGKRVILAADGPGLPRQPLRAAVLAARGCACSASGSPTHEQIDRICRMGGGFRMGPFELMDLVGIDVGLRGGQVVHRAVVRRAALAAQPDPGAHGRRRPARSQDGARLLRVPERRRLPGRRPGAARARRRRRGRSWRSSARGRWRTGCASARARRATSCARADRPSWSWMPAPTPGRRAPGRRAAGRRCAPRAASASRGEPGARRLPPAAAAGRRAAGGADARAGARRRSRPRRREAFFARLGFARRVGRGRARAWCSGGSSASS